MAFIEGSEGTNEPVVTADQPLGSGADVAARRPMKYRQTVLFAATAFVVMAIAATFAATKVNSTIAGVAERQVIGLAEENTTRDALHIQSMVVGGNSMIGMNADHSAHMATTEHSTTMHDHTSADGAATTAMESDSGVAKEDSHAGHVMTNGATNGTEEAMAMDDGAAAAAEEDAHAGHVMTNGATNGTGEAMAMNGDAAPAILTAADSEAGNSAQGDAAMILGESPLTLELLTGPAGLPLHFPMLVAGLGVVESSLFSPGGEMLWSTNPGAAGQAQISTLMVQGAASGDISSKLVKDNVVVGADGFVHTMDVVATYVPLQNSPSEPVVAVLEINREVGTELGALVDETKSTVLWTTVMTMGGLFLALVGFVVVSDRMIFKSHERQLVLVENQLSERKQAQDALSDNVRALEVSNQELEAFSYSVSHDLRGPLRTIDGFSKALIEDYHEQLDDEGKDFLSRVRAGTQRMGMLIDAMLTMSRASRGEMYREEVDLSEIVTSMANDLQAGDPKRKVEFIIAKNVTVVGDQRLLTGVLQNLLGNAWKFTGGHPMAVIEFGTTDHEGKLTYFIRDDGAGFDMTYVHKLFGAFQRLHPITEFEGTGVGLATAQRIIHRHGGQIWAEAEVEKGATFYFTL